VSWAEIRVVGDKVVEQEFFNIGRRSMDMEPAWPIIEGWLMEFARDQFGEEGGHGSTPWLPNAEATIEWKRRNNLRPEINRAYDLMYQALVEGSQDTLSIQSVDTLVWGADLVQFEVAQTGSVTQPARPVFDFTLAQANEVASIMRDYVVGARAVFRGAGGQFIRGPV
jgi:hypothetical protein